MTTGKRQLPQHPHIAYLRKEAKQRLTLLRQRATGTRLADAQYWLAQDYGFANWRALKEEVLRRMGIVRMTPQPIHHAKRFQRSLSTVDEDLEADGFFQRGAAVMGIGVIAALVIVATMMLMLFSGHAFGQTVAKPDTSPHTVQMITVADGVQLEVLDWGGTGRPLVFLAGLGPTGHDFDSFAPRFTAGHHVYAITRRGFGASSKPSPDGSNYSAERLGDDVLAVIDNLKLERPVLAGHSLAGEELSSVASRHPEKLAGVVYLDAAYAYGYYAPGNLNPSNVNLTMDVNALRQKIRALAPLWLKPQEGPAAIDQLLKTDIPQLQADLKAAQRAMREMPPAPPMPPTPSGAAQSPQMKINAAIVEGVEKFGTLNVPVLTIFASPHAPPPNAPSPAMLEYFKAVEAKSGGPELIARYRAGNPAAHVVVIANAQHAVFKSNADDVAREMDAFMAGLN
jgi:non-heme chloroperoxidase